MFYKFTITLSYIINNLHLFIYLHLIMKTFTLTCAILLVSSLGLFAQSGMTIHGSGAVTVNGNLIITPAPCVCGTPMTDTRDSKTYNTVLIGTQCWFAQNLNVGTRINGSSEQTNNSIIEKYCYNDDVNFCNTYGGLYQWDETMQYSTTPGVQGICPTGWHLPTDAEWTTLTTFLGGGGVAQGMLREAGLTHWYSPNTGATNSSGFTALPGGYRKYDGNFYNLTYFGYFWSSSELDGGNAWDRSLRNIYEDNIRYVSQKMNGISIRCLRD